MTLVAIGFVLLAAAVLVDLAGLSRGRRKGSGLGQLAVAAATVAAGSLAAAGAVGVAAAKRQDAALTWLTGGLLDGVAAGAVGPALTLDHLSGLFLLIVFGTAVPTLLVVIAWMRRTTSLPPGLASAVSLVLGSSALVVLAGNVFVLVLGWELVTAAFTWTTALYRRRTGRADAALVTAWFGKGSGAALLAGVLIVVGDSGRWGLLNLGRGAHDGWRSLAYVLLVLAFSVKVGLAPVHLWMPRSYSAAPGPVRAVLAGSAVNVGFYGLWRTLQVLGPPPGWLAIGVLVVGALTALLGVAHASIQTRVTAVVAYSSVENGGLICAAYGVGLVGAAIGDTRLTAAGLLAATLQVVAHALSKSLLFASAGTVEALSASDDIDAVRGVARVLPFSGTGIGVGSLALAGLPPTALFVSEWFILEALMQQFRVQALSFQLALAATGALVALTAGFAGVAFTRLAAFTAVGGTNLPRRARELGVLGRIGLVTLIASVFAVAVATPAEIHLLAAGLTDIVPRAVTDQAVASPFVLGPVFTDFSVLSPSWLAVELSVTTGLTVLLAWLLGRRRLVQVRRVRPWRSATGGVDGADEYTAFGYANPTRRVLANVVVPRTELRAVDESRPSDVSAEGTTPGTARGPVSLVGSGMRFTSDVIEVVEHYVYRPFERPTRWVVRRVTAVQSGSLAAYLLYMLVGLVAVLVLVVSASG